VEVSIRPEGPHDGDAIRALHSAAFGRPDEARLVDALRASSAFLPELSLVAEEDGRVVGHVLFSPVSLAEGEANGLLGLGPIAVLPERQRQGIGSRLIRVGLERAATLGCRAVVLVGHPDYYPRFGFTTASRFGLTCAYPVPDEVFMALPLRSGALDGVAGSIRYSSAFDGM